MTSEDFGLNCAPLFVLCDLCGRFFFNHRDHRALEREKLTVTGDQGHLSNFQVEGVYTSSVSFA